MLLSYLTSLVAVVVHPAYSTLTFSCTAGRVGLPPADFARSMWQVCLALIDSQEEIAPFIDGDFNEYVTEMADVQTWGGEPELAIVAEVLQLPVTVYQREQVS